MSAEQLLAPLDPEQREVATTLDGPVRVLAGAGTGKTRAITHRIAYGVATDRYHPSELLAVTFTTRAAGELRQRLARLGTPGVQARTFHSAALRQVKYFWPHLYDEQLPQVVSSKISLLAEAVSRSRLKAGQGDLRDLAGEVEWAKVSNVQPDDYPRLALAAGRRLDGYDAASVGAVYAAYEDVKRERRRIDLEDILLCAAAVLSDDERIAATIRRQYRTFVVDEYQDVSPIQARLLDLWLGGRTDLCVVGDPAQTVYSFAGASADYLVQFPRHHPGTTSITLSRNYRSTPQVIAAANSVTAASRGSAVELRAVREAGDEVTFTGYSDEVAEAAAIAARIEAAVAAGTPAAGIAVLFRVNAQSEHFEEALAEHGVPFVVRGAERFFDRAEVRQAVALLRGAARAVAQPTSDSADQPGDSADQLGRHPGEESGQGLADEVRGLLGSMGWSAQSPVGRGAARDRWESLQALVQMADEVAAGVARATLPAFVEELRRRAEIQHAPVAGGVTLTTLHAAKGLEWARVYVVGAQEGTVPIVYADSPAAIEEERRLFYVGLTRARDHLEVSWAQARTPGARATRQPSRFLDGVLDAEQRVSSGAAGSRRRSARARRITACRVCGRPLTDARERKLGRCTECPSSYDEALFERLRRWRRERASEEKVPAYCVFTDATLTALAELRPADRRGLVTVPGIGKSKVDKYGDDLLALCGQLPADTEISALAGNSFAPEKR